MDTIPSIAIVGAGFAGTMLAVQLAQQSRKPLRITLYDAAGQFARGVAYSTQDPSHLLNVRADRMGAFDDRHDDFYRWLVEHESQWRANHPQLSLPAVTPQSFMPRMIYGDYVEFLLEAAQHNENGVTIEQIQAEATDAHIAQEQVMVTLSDGSQCTFSYLVLALGSLPAAQHGISDNVINNPRYISALWTPLPGSILMQTDLSDEKGPVAIIGTGLTTIDAIASLRAKHYRGKIIAISPRGLLPQPHVPDSPAYSSFLAPEKAPRTALGLLQAVRNEITRAEGQGYSWHSVIDALRADTPTLWEQLPEKERKKFLRLLSFWNVHRHRMPPSSAEFIAQEQDRGTLSILKGRVSRIEETSSGLLIHMRSKGSAQTCVAAHVINCSGPQMNLEKSGNTLLKNLLKCGIIDTGPLQLGLAADSAGSVKSNASGRIFALGPLLVGERLETVAVPELRKQAGALARHLLAIV